MPITSLATRSDWQRRVALTAGEECLCDANWRFIAVSAAMGAHLGDEDIVGRSPMTLQRHRAYAGLLTALPVFDGKVRVVQFCSESWRDGRTYTRDLAFWPVLTNEDEFLVHVVAHQREAKPAPEFRGLRITELRIVMLDGSVLGSEPSVAAR